MSPVKSQDSSRRKGKAVASDSPAVLEEMEGSDLEWSAEEEMERDPNSECAPLLDPWYEINPHSWSGDGAPPPTPSFSRAANSP